MQNILEKYLEESKYVLTDHRLEDSLLVDVQKRIDLQYRTIFFVHLLGILFSTLFLFVFAKYVYMDLINSGFYGYFQILILEDIDTIHFVFKEMMYTFFEVLPVINITMLFGCFGFGIFFMEKILILHRKRFLFKS